MEANIAEGLVFKMTDRELCKILRNAREGFFPESLQTIIPYLERVNILWPVVTHRGMADIGTKACRNTGEYIPELTPTEMDPTTRGFFIFSERVLSNYLCNLRKSKDQRIQSVLEESFSEWWYMVVASSSGIWESYGIILFLLQKINRINPELYKETQRRVLADMICGALYIEITNYVGFTNDRMYLRDFRIYMELFIKQFPGLFDNTPMYWEVIEHNEKDV